MESILLDTDVDASSHDRDLRIRPGKPYPRGSTWDGMGVNFALHSEHAEKVELLLFDDRDATEPSTSFELPEKTGPIWHGYIVNLRPGQLYGYRVYGPYDPAEGHRFNPNKVLLDPYAKAIGRPLRWDDALFGYEIGSEKEDLSFSTKDSAPYAPLAAVIEETFSWGNDRAPEIPWEDTIIYETHVKGLTEQHPEVPKPLQGTYLGLASDPIIDHLKDLGITTVQLLPVHAKLQDRHLLQKGLRNYWGYNTLAYFAPEPEYSTNGPVTAVRDFKMMVRALHDAGLLRTTGDDPEVDNTYLSYLHTCVPTGEPTDDDYADMEPFFDAELRAIAAHVLLPVGERAIEHVVETCTAHDTSTLDIERQHATELLGSGWLVMPIREPTAWSSDDASSLVDAIDRLRATDYRRESDLGRFVAGNDPYLVR